MNLRKLKKHNQEKHGWWDTVKGKSRYDYPDYLNVEYYMDCTMYNKAPKKFVYPPFYFSSGNTRSTWRPAP